MQTFISHRTPFTTLQAPVVDLDALRLVPVTDLDDATGIYVESERTLFFYLADAEDVDDDLDVITPTGGSGRWVREGYGASVVPHAPQHQHGGSDEVATGTPAANAIPKANSSGLLATGWLGTGSALATTVLRGDNSWGTVGAATLTMASQRVLGRDTSGSGAAEELTVGGGLEFTGSLGLRRAALTGGDVTAPAGSAVLTIGNNKVTDVMLRDSAGLSVIGRSASSTGDPADIVAGSDGDVLRRSGTTIGFGSIPESSVTGLVTDLAAKVAATRTISTTSPLLGGGDLATDRTLSIQQANNTQDGYLSSSDWATFNNKVATTRAISTTAPLSGGGDLSADRTLAISQATTSVDGYLSSTDWNTFNNKVATTRAINTTAPLTGGGDLSADRTLGISDFVASGASHARGAVPDPGAVAGTTKFLREDATFAVALQGSTGGTDNAALRADGVTGTTVQGSPLLISDAGQLDLPNDWRSLVRSSPSWTSGVAVAIDLGTLQNGDYVCYVKIWVERNTGVRRIWQEQLVLRRTAGVLAILNNNSIGATGAFGPTISWAVSGDTITITITSAGAAGRLGHKVELVYLGDLTV